MAVIGPSASLCMQQMEKSCRLFLGEAECCERKQWFVDSCVALPFRVWIEARDKHRTSSGVSWKSSMSNKMSRIFCSRHTQYNAFVLIVSIVVFGQPYNDVANCYTCYVCYTVDFCHVLRPLVYM